MEGRKQKQSSGRERWEGTDRDAVNWVEGFVWLSDQLARLGLVPYDLAGILGIGKWRVESWMVDPAGKMQPEHFAAVGRVLGVSADVVEREAKLYNETGAAREILSDSESEEAC